MVFLGKRLRKQGQSPVPLIHLPVFVCPLPVPSNCEGIPTSPCSKATAARAADHSSSIFKKFPETTAEFSIIILKLHNSPNLFHPILGGWGGRRVEGNPGSCESAVRQTSWICCQKGCSIIYSLVTSLQRLGLLLVAFPQHTHTPSQFLLVCFMTCVSLSFFCFSMDKNAAGK